MTLAREPMIRKVVVAPPELDLASAWTIPFTFELEESGLSVVA